MIDTLLVKNGLVCDPSSDICDNLDIFIENGRIKEVGHNLDKDVFTINAKGYIVSPGFIDNHCHIYAKGTSIGLFADCVSYSLGNTVLVDAGSSGCGNYGAFHDTVVVPSDTQIFSYLNVATTGQIISDCPENPNPRYIHKNLIEGCLKQYKEIRGLKLRFDKTCTKKGGLNILKYSADLAHDYNLPLVVHIVNHPNTIREILNILEKGDIVCHCFHNNGESLLDDSGRVQKCAWDAKERGVIFEAADDFHNYSIDVIRSCIDEGFLPDIISTDMYNQTAFYKCGYGLPFVMSKYLALGVDIKDVIKMVTANVAKVLKQEDIGNLNIGSQGNITIFKAEKGRLHFSSFDTSSCEANKVVTPFCTIKQGVIKYANPLFYTENL